MNDEIITDLDWLDGLPARTKLRRVGRILAGSDTLSMQIASHICRHVFSQKPDWGYREVLTMLDSLRDENGTLRDWIVAEQGGAE